MFTNAVEFGVVKLLDYQTQWAALEASRNPFAIVVVAHLKAQETKRNATDRKAVKLNLIRRLYESGYGRSEVVNLFRFIDWVMILPDGLKQAFCMELKAYIDPIGGFDRCFTRSQGRGRGCGLRTLQTTSWTSFAFDPPEAVIQSLFLIGIVFVLPIHFITLIAVLVTMTVWAVVNHVGIELLPPSFPHHWFGKWFIGPAHHSIHHHRYSKHYGLYFTFWDKMLSTHDPNYDYQLD